MHYTSRYSSPLGAVLLAADGDALTGLWFEGQKYFALHLDNERRELELPVFSTAKRWLDVYFSGREPDFGVPVRFTGTPFRRGVWRLLRSIPYGRTTTYGELARRLAKENGLPRVSARAVGGAVARNEISVVVPCHRVVGADGSLTGYAGGLDRKVALLEIEGAMKDGFYVPKHSAAPRMGTP